MHTRAHAHRSKSCKQVPQTHRRPLAVVTTDLEHCTQQSRQSPGHSLRRPTVSACRQQCASSRHTHSTARASLLICLTGHRPPPPQHTTCAKLPRSVGSMLAHTLAVPAVPALRERAHLIAAGERQKSGGGSAHRGAARALQPHHPVPTTSDLSSAGISPQRSPHHGTAPAYAHMRPESEAACTPLRLRCCNNHDKPPPPTKQRRCERVPSSLPVLPACADGRAPPASREHHG